MLGLALSRTVQWNNSLNEDVYPIDETTWIVQQIGPNYKLQGGRANMIKSLCIELTAANSVVCVTHMQSIAFETVCMEESLIRKHCLERQTVLVMPLRRRAKVIDFVDIQQLSELRGDAVRWFLGRFPFLQLRRSAFLTTEPWIVIELLGGSARSNGDQELQPDRPSQMLWPASLCLVNMGVDQPGSCDEDKDTIINYEDPIRLAEEWFHASATRAREDDSIQQQDLAPEQAAQYQEDENAMNASPVYLRNEPGSAQGVYPTPPDGFVPSLNHPMHPLLTSDLAGEELSTNENHPTASHGEACEDVDIAMADNGEDDNLFGELDDEMLSDPDITDADFNFFDTGSVVRRRASRLGDVDMQSADEKPSYSHMHEQALLSHVAPGDEFPHSEEPRAELVKSCIEQNDGLHQEELARARPTTMSRRPQSPPETPPLSPVAVRSSLVPVSRKPNHDPVRNLSYAHVDFWNTTAASRLKYSRGGKFDVDTSPEENVPQSSTLKRSISLHDYEYAVKRVTLARVKNSAEQSYRSAQSTCSDESDTESAHMAEPSSSGDRLTRPVETVPLELKGPACPTTDLLRLLNNVKNILGQNQIPSGEGRRSMIDLGLPSPNIEENLWQLFDFDGLDLIATAQLLAHHAAASLHSALRCDRHQSYHAGDSARQSSDPLTAVTGVEPLSLLGLAAMVNATIITEGDEKQTMRLGLRRLQMPNGMSLVGQVLNFLSAPMVRVKRADTTWDVTSSAIQFSDVLGLEPLHSPKNVIADAIMIGTDDTKSRCSIHLCDLQYQYERSAFGTFTIGNKILVRASEVAMRSPVQEQNRTFTTLLLLKKACSNLAHKINQKLKKDPQANRVVIIFSPFTDASMDKYICACFQTIVKDVDKSVKGLSLQIIPFNQIICYEAYGGIGPWPFAKSALSLYDCIPSDEAPSTSSVWKGFAAKSLALVPLPLRKINFTLSEQPPINLLAEAQILHVACAISADENWLVLAWTDYSGNHQDNLAFCLYKTNLDTVMTAVKEYISSLLTVNITWRIIVAIASTSDAELRAHWTSLAGICVAVTVAEVSLSPPLQIYGNTLPLDSDVTAPTTPAIPQTATLTPASTPQAINMAISPDTNQPLTPSSAVDQQSSANPTLDLPTTDADAQLIDTRDDSYGLTLSFPATPRPIENNALLPRTHTPFASGLLVKRGENRPGVPLPTLGIDIIENVTPKMPPGRTTWLLPRTPDYLIREILGWYRGLAVLGRLRNVAGCERGEVPWHIGVVIAGAEALEGFFE